MPRLTYSLITHPLIAIFWLVMWVLLIRTELRPMDAATRAVPVDHIAKLLFHDEQASELYIHDEGSNLGTLRILPRTHVGNDRRVLDFSGSLQVRPSETERRRVAWEGTLEFDASFSVQLLHLAFSVREGPGPGANHSRIELTIDPEKHVASYLWKGSDGYEDAQNYTLDQPGLQQLLDHLGIDPAMVPSSSLSSIGSPRITARQATLEMHNGRVDTYLVTVVQNGQTLLEVQISELGKILQARTILGWTLESE